MWRGRESRPGGRFRLMPPKRGVWTMLVQREVPEFHFSDNPTSAVVGSGPTAQFPKACRVPEPSSLLPTACSPDDCTGRESEQTGYLPKIAVGQELELSKRAEIT